MKLKTYILMVSKDFPKTHPRAGESTGFIQRIKLTVSDLPTFSFRDDGKLHTCRSNFEFWHYRVKQISRGLGSLSIRYWVGPAYHSKQVEIVRLNKVGIQAVKIRDGKIWVDSHAVDRKLFIQNDGFQEEADFNNWFPKKWDGAVIHFTDFRYQ